MGSIGLLSAVSQVHDADQWILIGSGGSERFAWIKESRSSSSSGGADGKAETEERWMEERGSRCRSLGIAEVYNL